MKSKTLAFLLLCVAVFPIGAKAQCSPFQGLGATQFLNNSGVPLTNGVLYSFQASTSTQQATFTDSTCSVQNNNPITFSTGGRVSIWATTGNFYKWVLCLQNDGPTCAPSDVLFSVDNVPGGATSGGGGGGPPFISGSPNPATNGILRCASGDQCLAFRNAANSANLAITKDTNDVLSWSGGAIKFPELSCTNTIGGFDYFCASSTNHRWLMANNGGSQIQIAAAGVDINTSDQVTQLHFGATAAPLSGTAPTTGQFLEWNGTNIVGTFAPFVVYSTASASTNVGIGSTTMATAGGSGNVYRFGAYIDQTVLGVGCTGNTTISLNLIFTDPNLSSPTTFLLQQTAVIITNGSVGTAFASIVTGQIRAKASTTVGYSTVVNPGTGCSTVPSYQVYPILEQMTIN